MLCAADSFLYVTPRRYVFTGAEANDRLIEQHDDDDDDDEDSSVGGI